MLNGTLFWIFYQQAFLWMLSMLSSNVLWHFTCIYKQSCVLKWYLHLWSHWSGKLMLSSNWLIALNLFYALLYSVLILVAYLYRDYENKYAMLCSILLIPCNSLYYHNITLLHIIGIVRYSLTINFSLFKQEGSLKKTDNL